MSLAKDIEAARALWERLPSDWRARMEGAAAGIAAQLGELPADVSAILEEFKPVAKRVAIKAASEGLIGGSWRGLHRALEQRWPELYAVLKEHLPK